MKSYRQNETPQQIFIAPCVKYWEMCTSTSKVSIGWQYFVYPVTEVSLIWFTGNVASDCYLMLTMNNNFLIQISGLENDQCASLAHNRHGAPALPSLSSLSPKPQFEQELPYHYLELDTSVGNVCVDEGEMRACAQVSGRVWQPGDTRCFSWMWALPASAVENSALHS